MADTDVWALGGPIAAPAGTDRVPFATGSGAGGYSRRDAFAYRVTVGYLIGSAPSFTASVPTLGAVSNSTSLYLTNNDPNYGLNIGVAGSGRPWLQAQRNDATSSVYAIMLNPLGGGLFVGGDFNPMGDNASDIGSAGGDRFRNIRLVNSPIVTSDAGDKEWLGDLSAAEVAAAKRIAREPGLYKWLSSIATEAEGGPAARIHVGVRAQSVWAIMADEGLIGPIVEGEPPRSEYSFLCWDPKEEGDTVGRFGVRADELFWFVVAGQEARLAALEAAI